MSTKQIKENRVKEKLKFPAKMGPVCAIAAIVSFAVLLLAVFII